MPLRSTIHQLTARDGDLASIGADPQAFIQSWRNDLAKLFETIRSSLNNLESEGLVSFGYVTFNVEEEGLGKYSAPGLTLEVANRTICLAPQARLTSGGAGRVDMFKRDNPSSDGRVWIVRRFVESGDAIWMIEKKEEKKNLRFSAILMPLQAFDAPKKEYTQIYTEALEASIEFLLRD